ncbi:MAG: AAA family ATPase, partial [Sulfitobacter sp.]
LGEGKMVPAAIKSRFGGLKPCLHGSDAHKNDDVGEAHEDRFSWIKGGCTFDSLRQACIDPGGRAYIGPKPPATAMPSQVVDSIEITEADWLCTPRIELNSGLVTIIGARGSGKTALADMIAAGCDALPESLWSDDNDSISSSFLARAKQLIGDARVKLTWGGGDEVTRALDGSESDFATSYPRARYLSQRFVEDLCSSTQGPSDGLIAEIERVIFDAHDDDSKDGALNFRELCDRKIDRFRQTRERESESLAQVSQRIGEEHEKERLVPALVRNLAVKTTLIDGYRADLSKLVIKESEAEIKRHGELTEAIQAKQTTIESFRNQRRSFETLQDEVTNMRASRAPEMLRETQSRIAHSGFSAEQWDEFLLDYKGPVDDKLPSYIRWVDQQVAKIKGAPVVPPEDKSALLTEDADLGAASLIELEYEIGRLEGLLKADKLVRDRFSALSKRIREEEREKEKLTKRLTDAQGAGERRKALHLERGQSYQNIFAAVLAEENALAALYGPLQQRLLASSGTLNKLRFSVYRVADAESWAGFAEENLLDRRTGQLKGRGTLTDIAASDLKPVWESGTAEEAKAAMDAFISDYHEALLSYAPVPREEEDAFRVWLGRFAQWLFSTDHLSVRYGISYDGVDITNLSPGTRGIVLLLLYLALDDGDDRPLIIDQPEENLDPKSVYDELVSLFLEAKCRRQVIMVTHNANLVINTDADQIILAEAGDHSESGLPKITYLAGGLEDKATRKIVCDILEGGADAFQERARRLRVKLPR